MENIKVDAEYMNRWLGNNPIDEMNPRVMYDVQQLIKHYRSIIVPDKDVSVEFPVDGTPCAAVENSTVMVPCNLLLDGRVDETIGAMIHELHHIKWTEAPKAYMYAVWTFFKNATKRITLDDGSVLYDVVFNDTDITFKNIMSNEVKNPSSGLQFVGQVFQDIHLIINALEDIRIDGNTPKNLKKYIDKGDANAFPPYKEACAKGELAKVDVYSLPYHLLFHHKGYCSNDYVKDTFEDTDFILNNPPSKLVVKALLVYEELLTDHIKNLFQNTDMEKQGGGDSLDSYLGDMIMGDVENNLEEGAGKELNAEDKEQIAKALEGMEQTQTPLNDCEFSQPELSNAAVQVTIGESSSKMFHQNQKAEKKNRLISAELDAQIKSFSRLQVVTTTEEFSRPLTYDTVIYDATN